MKRVPWLLLLPLPPAVAVMCIIIGVAIDSVLSRQWWWLPFLFVGVVAISASAAASVLTAISVSRGRGSKLTFVAVLLSELIVSYLTWSYAYAYFVPGWR